MRTLIPLAAFLLTMSIEAQAGDAKEMHDGNCVRCHGSEVYTRENRRVTTRPGLTKQVRRCTTMLGIQWFDDDINAVADYLNSTFYKF